MDALPSMEAAVVQKAVLFSKTMTVTVISSAIAVAQTAREIVMQIPHSIGGDFGDVTACPLQQSTIEASLLLLRTG
jgi:hypothetical protein